MIAAITCVDNSWGIGYNGELLEHIPEDMRFFKEIVTNKIVIVGRKTWDSIPKNRNFLTRNTYLVLSNEYEEDYVCIPNTHTCYIHSDKLLKWLNSGFIGRDPITGNDKEIIIIGGASIYQQLLSYCDTVYITHIYKRYENVDTYFPKLDENEWQRTALSEIKQYNNISYQFWRYDRIN